MYICIYTYMNLSIFYVYIYIYERSKLFIRFNYFYFMNMYIFHVYIMCITCMPGTCICHKRRPDPLELASWLGVIHHGYCALTAVSLWLCFRWCPFSASLQWGLHLFPATCSSLFSFMQRSLRRFLLKLSNHLSLPACFL